LLHGTKGKLSLLRDYDRKPVTIQRKLIRGRLESFSMRTANAVSDRDCKEAAFQTVA